MIKQNNTNKDNLMTDITHNPTTQRFETTIDGHTGFLSYEVMVKHALDYANEHNKKVVPSCSFVASYINRRPEYQHLLA